MRLLHTSDWHLGRRLHGTDLTDAHAAWVDHLVEVVRERSVDVLLVAGDVFDRAVPPVESVQLWDEALARVVDAGAAVVVSSGNHDSPVRLGVHASLIADRGVHVRCEVDRVGEPVTLQDEHGTVALYPLPFLEPTTTAGRLAALSAPGVPALRPDEPGPVRTQAGVVRRAAALASADAAASGHRRSIAMAHTWVAGVRAQDRCDSEREIGVDRAAETRVGTLDRVPAHTFDAFSYTALGHLHGAQVLGERLRYSGSPAAFSFSERHHRKSSWLVDLDATGAVVVERVPAPVHRGLVQLHGRLEDLLVDPAHSVAERSWVKAVLSDAARPDDAMRRLQARFPHAVTLEWAPEGRVEALPYARLRAGATSDTDVAVGFVAHVRGTEATAAERDVLASAFHRLRAEAVAEAVGAVVPVEPAEAVWPEELRALDDSGPEAEDDLFTGLSLAGTDDGAPARAHRRGAA